MNRKEFLVLGSWNDGKLAASHCMPQYTIIMPQLDNFVMLEIEFKFYELLS